MQSLNLLELKKIRKIEKRRRGKNIIKIEYEHTG